MEFSNILAELKKISVSHLCDAESNIRLFDNSINQITDSFKMIGKAFTVYSEGDLLPIIKAIDTAEPGSVIVIDSCNSKKALAGEIFSTAAFQRGLSGIVIDGYCRDINSIRNVELPFYAKGVNPKAGTKEKVGELQIEITCGGVKVLPGEIIFGDENGIVVLNDSELLNLLPLSKKIYSKEEEALIKIRSGARIIDIFNFEDHYNNVLLGKESKFNWTV